MIAKTVALSLLASATSAATVGFEFSLAGDADAPTLTITNTSDTADLVFLTVHIGDTTHMFDAITNLTNPTGGVSTLILGDAADNGSGTDMLGIAFSGFGVGESVSFDAEIDPDTGNASVDYASVLFNNGGIDNALFVASFSTGEALRYEVPDFAQNSEYSVDLTLDVNSGNITAVLAPVPVPAGLPLLGAGLLAFGAMRIGGNRRTG
jgi:hypothetical protein